MNGDGRMPWFAKALAVAGILVTTVYAVRSCDRHAHSIHGERQARTVAQVTAEDPERRWVGAIVSQAMSLTGAFRAHCNTNMCTVRLSTGSLGYMFPDGSSYIITPDQWRLVPRAVTDEGITYYRGGRCYFEYDGVPYAICTADRGLGNGGAL